MNDTGNPQYLKSNSERTPLERKELARKAGQASGRARKEKRTLKELVSIVLSKQQTNAKGETESNKMIMMIQLVNRAVQGDLKAIALVQKILNEDSQKVDITSNGKDLIPQTINVFFEGEIKPNLNG